MKRIEELIRQITHTEFFEVESIEDALRDALREAFELGVETAKNNGNVTK